METTADGLAEAIVTMPPAKRPKYELAAAGIIASAMQRTIARNVRCGIGSRG
jgi:hypothetical protein